MTITPDRAEERSTAAARRSGGTLGGYVGMGLVTALVGLTARAIRLYEERGLVQAVRGRGGRRLYDAKARGRLQAIATLRRLGMGLFDIEDILAAGGTEHGEGARLFAEWLEEREEQLQGELDAVRQAGRDLSPVVTTPRRRRGFD